MKTSLPDYGPHQGRMREFTKGEAVTAVDESPPQAKNFFSPPDYCM